MLELVSDFITAFINFLSVFFFAKIILQQKIHVKKYILILLMLFMSSLLLGMYYLNISTIKTIFCFIMVIILVKIVYSLDIIKSILLAFGFFVIQILSDIITINIFTLVFGKEQFYEVFAGGFFPSLSVLLLISFLALLLRKVIVRILNIRIKHKLIFIVIITFLCIIIVFYATFKYGTTTVDNLIGFFCLTMIIITLGYSFLQIYKNNKLTEEYDKLLEFIKKYEVEIDNQRILRHETKNQLLTIKSKIVDKDKNESIINYINEIIKEDKKVKHSEYAKFKSLPSNGIKGLFYFKVSLAQDKNIKVNVNISESIEKSFLGMLDGNSFNQIGKVLGVYLDNAIEGADTSDDKLMGIEVFTKEEDIVIIISNSYNANSKFIGRSTKGTGRGYGLLLANNIINSTKRLESFTEVTDSLYIKKLIIKNNHS